MKKIVILIGISFLIGQNVKNPIQFNSINNKIYEKKNTSKNILLIPIKFYRLIAGQIKKGDYCQFYPTCSSFGYEAVKKHSMMGWMMAFDRMNRCGHDLHLYVRVIIKDRIKYLDLVPNK